MDPIQQPPSFDIPTVRVLGDVEHADFAEAFALLHATARVSRSGVPNARSDVPEVFVLAESRPGMIAAGDVELLRRGAPLAGMIALVGSWCEGEMRSGRPHAGVCRLYWHEFPAWWRRQLALRAAGRCPDWARPASREQGTAPRADACSLLDGLRPERRGLVVLETTCWETADVLAEVLRAAGFATAWLQPRSRPPQFRGVTAGIWEGRQLDEPEIGRLAAFCEHLSADHAPVIALADFPRRDRCERARGAGAALVMGKPWLNADLLGALKHVLEHREQVTAATSVTRAA